MKFREILKVFQDEPYHYCYKIDYDNKIVTEYRVMDYESDPEGTVSSFPYEVLSYEPTAEQVYDPEWTIIDADGKEIKGLDD